MSFEDNKSQSYIMEDLNIPLSFYIILVVVIIILIIIKYIFSTEEIFQFIDKAKKNSLKYFKDESDMLNLLTKLNTKINRDFLDNSEYYNKVGYSKIYGCENEKNKKNLSKSEKTHKIIINKKVRFNNEVIFENEGGDNINKNL